MTDFIEAAEVADITGYSSAAAFLRDRTRIEDEQGFPLPMPTSRRPLKWRADQIRSWVQASGTPKQFTPPKTGGNVVLLREAASA
ncbi:MAG TPA: hypothetical protein ENK28_03480 [Aliiroseovarius sp.]|nr:hypothetical protein [Aliiroseovarius sp.]